MYGSVPLNHQEKDKLGLDFDPVRTSRIGLIHAIGLLDNQPFPSIAVD